MSNPDPTAGPPPQRLFGGTSGWSYPSWKPGFYPAKLAASRFLNFYATQLNSVEVNFTFRKLPTPAQLAGWLAETPEGFRFSFKAPQRITHFARLRDCEEHVAALLAAVAPAALSGKLGLLLFQLPPNFKADLGRLRMFLANPALRAAGAPHLAWEFRHESWFTDEVYGVLREYSSALCVAENDELQTPEVQTAATHTAFRLRRAGGYTAEEIDALVVRLQALSTTRDVYAYFKHEDEPTGALNAVSFLVRAAASLSAS